MAKLTKKQQRFCEEYLVDLNATQAAIRAGYSKKTAYAIGEENLRKPDLKAYIDEHIAKIQSECIANTTEIMKYLTSVMRGQEQEPVVVVESAGDGVSKARTLTKDLGAKDRIKAAELLGKRYSLFTEKLEVDSKAVVIVDNIPKEGTDV